MLPHYFGKLPLARKLIQSLSMVESYSTPMMIFLSHPCVPHP